MPHYEAKSFVVNQLDKKHQLQQPGAFTEIVRGEVGATSCLCMCICVRVSLSICIAYLAAIWPAKQYHESEKSDNENVLSMATMKGA